MGNPKMIQIAGSHSTNIQIGGDLTIGVSAEHARQIALEVFDANFLRLSEQAARTAQERAQELADEFVRRLYDERPDAAEKLRNPAVQYSLFNVQREYAKTGNVHCKEEQLKLLIHRIASEEQSLKQIVLDEAIETLPKLSREQRDFIAYIFAIDNLATRLLQKEFELERQIIDTGEFFERVALFCRVPSKELRRHLVSHLQYLGCIREVIDSGQYFDSPILSVKRLLSRHCGRDIDEEQIARTLQSVDRNLALYYKLWNMRRERSIKLTTVGLVIAITHYNARTGAAIPLDDFI